MMDSIIPDLPCETFQKKEKTLTLPGLIKPMNEMEPKAEFDFIAKPLHLSSCDYTLSKPVEGQSNSTEKDIVCTYINTEGDEEIISQAEFGFGISEEIVESELCDEGILIDKMAYTNSVQTPDTLPFCSILDQIPEGNDLVDGNVNIELYLECSDDNENNSHEQLSGLKQNYMIAEATSQIKMDTQFKVSFPLIPERGLKCSMCKLLFLSKDYLREHTVMKHFTDFLFCNFCPYFTKSKKFFNTHVQTRHLQSSVTDGCLSALRNETKIVVEVTDEETVNGVSIPDVSPIGNLTETERSGGKSEKQSIQCASENLKRTNKTEDYDVRCVLCGFRTKSNRLLNYHKQTMHNKKRELFRCTDCEYTCLQRRSFESHLKRHTGVFEFQCKICDKKFVSKHLLTKHARKHTLKPEGNMNNKILVNDSTEIIATSCSTSTQTKLVKKDFIHWKNTVYSIDKSINDSNIESHESLFGHKPDSDIESNASSCGHKPIKKKFECTFSGCDKVFRDSFNLRNHLAVHTKSKAIKCDFCMFTCIQMSSLNHHIKTRHK